VTPGVGPDADAGPAVVLVTGTGTEVGKTWVAAALAGALAARGLAVAARKPAQSYEPGDADAGRTDAHALAAATGEDPAVVCPPHRWYPLALAPPMAAAALGRPAFTVADLAGELRRGWPAGADVVIVETAGGVRSPLADDGDAVALAGHLGPHRDLLVADPGLGTINAVRLSADALTVGAPAGKPPLVFLNRFDPDDALHTANRDWLGRRAGLPVVTAVAELAGIVGPARARRFQ
jgi:dethiobiotin synthetase